VGDWKEWSSWIREGHFVSFVHPEEKARIYEHVIARDLAHYVYEWPETVSAGEESGPHVPGDLQVTQGYDEGANTNRIWQLIFGIKGQVYIYVELPTDIHRHGLPKVPKPSRTLREVSHFEEWMSPFHEPSFITEHIMIKPWTDRIAFTAYNPTDVDLKPYLNIFVNRLVTERIGVEKPDGTLEPAKPKFREVLEKLAKRVIPHRPLTILPVRAPASGR